jgi:putative ABC transport system permease protein
MNTVDSVDPDDVVERAAARLRTLPGVEAVGLATGPAGQHGWPGFLPDTEFQDRQAPRNVVFSEVGPGFFAAMRTPLLEGREFDERDLKGAPKVAIVNRLLAERLWPGQQATGRVLRVWNGEPPLRIVGVSETIHAMPINPPWPTVHLPTAQHKHDRLTIHVRAPSLGTKLALGQIAAELQKAGSAFRTARPQTLREAQGRFFTAMGGVVRALASIGGMALLLAALGLYGLTSYVVGRRLKEIGIRRALGAGWVSVYALIVGGTMRAVAFGLGLGILASLGAGYIVKEALLGTAFDPSALLVAPLLLAATSLLAASVPALRSTRVDPAVVLREL